MTPDLLVWLLSLTEAALFFAGGVLFALYRADATEKRGARAQEAPRPTSEPTVAGEERGVYQSALANALVSGEVLRGILDRETRHRDVAGAVIADDLGLVVAGKGALCDVLAAYGAVLAGIGEKTREVLPLRELRKLVIQDAADMTLTVRPIATADDQFALVTLTCGQQSGEAPASGSAERISHAHPQ
jgi:predicted regulator of Ras-like GTPase activity (Roadblock/LC7/MglB family)